MAEAAGIALAVLSLLVSALENYDECASVSKAWFGYEREFKKVTRRIKRLDLQYRYLLKRLLRPVVSDAEWQAITSDPWHPEWKEIEHRLRRRLPPDEYGTYMETIEDLASTMQQLQRKLLPDNSKHSGQQVSGMQTPQSKLKRFTFAFGERSRGKILGEIEGLLVALRILIDGHENITRTQWTKGSPSPELSAAEHQFWRCAHLFHSALVSALSCSCSPSYYADLDLTYNNQVNPQPRVLLHGDQTTQNLTAEHRAWTSLTMTVSLAELPLSSRPPLTTQEEKNSSQTQQRSLKKKLDRFPFGKKKKESLEIIPSSQHTGSIGSSLAPLQQLLPVTNLCKLIPDFNGICQGRLDLPSSYPNFRSFINFIVQESSAISQPANVIRLASWHRTRAAPAPRQLRLSVATKITWTHLPLPSDQWTPAPGTADDVVFLNVDGSIDLTHPYLRRQHGAPRMSTHTSGTPSAFVHLGLSLVQLCYGSPLDTSPIGQHWPHPDFRPDDKTAALWANAVETELGPGYAQAVEWCLSNHTIAGDQLTGEYYREVIVPVRECYEYFSSRKP